MSYGLPYMGSKQGIADELIRIFPKATHFYDLFGGGFSITHAMLLRRSKDFKQFHFNEIRPGICGLIQKAIAGEYNYDVFKPKFIDRETFFAQKDSDACVKMIWSFGNNGQGYLFSKEIEPYKKSMHNAIVFNEFDELARKTIGIEKFRDGYSINQKRLFLRSKIERYRITKIPEFLLEFLSESQRADLENIDNLRRLQQLQRLEQLQQLQQLERLSFYNTSYEGVPILDGSIIYCDIPYKGTAEYCDDFDHAKFFDWADKQLCPVFVSEYDIQDKRFKPVFRTEKRSMLSGNKDKCTNKIEKVYGNRAAIAAISGK